MQSEVFTAICASIAEGSGIVSACQAAQVDKATFFRHLASHPEDCDKYARARQTRADSRFESVDEIAAEVKAKTIAPDAARVLIDAIKWQCGKESPKRYGDRLELAGDKDNPLAVSWVDVQRTLRERRARRTKDSGTEPTES